jgi:hypothetical protein
LDSELKKLTSKRSVRCDNYILITNVPLSGVHQTGTLDRIHNVFKKYRAQVPHLAVWGADDVSRFLDSYPDVRTSYLPLLVAGDIIAQLLNLSTKPREDRAITVDLFLRAAITREEHAQLDQAGDVSEQPVPLQQVFFDLDGYVENINRSALERMRKRGAPAELPLGEDKRTTLVKFFLNTSLDRTVLVGGPGEGKSTVGQYLAQLHRATLLGRADEIALSSDYIPELPRLPFRIVLRDFAQWLAARSADSSESDSLDSFISETITRLSSRPFADKDLHEILRSDPALLILDGLDEVTDASVRKRLVSRLLEFVERCQSGLHADLQVIATTRPTGYTDQFDPNSFVHFRLHKLVDAQVKDYVDKWASARVQDEGKAIRLRQTIDGCLADPQISLLMTTPLQVTILILIINSGGTPPRQREALFDEYLDVIYKREKGKGLGIIKSEKELLIGLHKHIGFLLHEKATNARTSAAVLPRADYDQVVRRFLRHHDPYSPASEIEQEWHAITIDAGERLVLIVESPADIFGFELRSIQEFFAACFLCDTATNTTQRYERLTAIARLTHWRNVTLFFAGRVGRNNPGEAANVVEVCREIDRSGPDLFVKRGAEVALELAADRALEPNRVLQRSLLEHGLGAFQSLTSDQGRSQRVELIKRLPPEDIRDHVLPIFEQMVRTADSVVKYNVCNVLGSVVPNSPLLRSCILDLVAEADERIAVNALSIIAGSDIPNGLRLDVLRSLQAREINHSLMAKRLATSSWATICAVADGLSGSGLASEFIREFAAAVLEGTNYFLGPSVRGTDVRGTDQRPCSDSPVSELLRVASEVATVMSRHYGVPTAESFHVSPQMELVVAGLPDDVKRGVFEPHSTVEDAAWMLWFAHLSLGDVTEESWQRFVSWRSNYEFPEAIRELWEYFSSTLAPVAALALASNDVEELEAMASAAVSLGGLDGISEWMRRLRHLTNELQGLSVTDRFKLALYGPAVLPSDWAERVNSALDSLFPAQLHLLAVSLLGGPSRDIALSLQEFESLSEWYRDRSTYACRDDTFAYRILLQAVRLGQLGTPAAKVFLKDVRAYLLPSLALYVVASSETNDDSTKAFLRESGLWHNAEEPSRVFIGASIGSLRDIVAALTRLTMDEDDKVSEVACGLLLCVCRDVATRRDRRTAIRSREVAAAQERLLAASRPHARNAGIALYALRPPRSNSDWRQLSMLFKDATVKEIQGQWSWVMHAAAELSNQPDLWTRQITAILQEGGVNDELFLILSDVLRNMLPRHTQSLAGMTVRLDLPSDN